MCIDRFFKQNSASLNVFQYLTSLTHFLSHVLVEPEINYHVIGNRAVYLTKDILVL